MGDAKRTGGPAHAVGGADAVAVLDRSGRVIAMGAALAARLGVSPADAEGRPLAALAWRTPGDRERVAAWVGAAQREGRAELAGLTAADGGALALEAVRLDPPGWLAVAPPAEKAATVAAEGPPRGLAAGTASILRDLGTALVVVDGAGRITLANPAAARILGEPAAALSGRAIWDWFPDRPRDAVPVARTLRDGVQGRGEEATVTRADGSRVPIGMSCAPLRDGADRPAGAAITFQDLSEVKQLERQALQAEKMASVGQLAAGVAHEINNPMGFIHANLCQVEEYLRDLAELWQHVDALRKAAAEGGPDAVRAAAGTLDERARELDAAFLLDDAAKAIRESQEGAERIRHIVQDLRAFSHGGEGEPEFADLNECLDSTARIAWAMMKHRVRLERRLGELPPVRCRPGQMRQVFMNLLLNAYQAVEERLRRDGAAQGTIVLETAVCEEGVRIAVEDDGVGLPPGAAHRIFEPFFTTRPVGVGMGLGLSTSYSLVRGHGGTLRAHPRPGGGAVFEVRLPVDGGGPAAPGAP